MNYLMTVFIALNASTLLSMYLLYKFVTEALDLNREITYTRIENVFNKNLNKPYIKKIIQEVLQEKKEMKRVNKKK